MAKRNTKADRLENPNDYFLHPTKGYRRLRPYVRDFIRMGEAKLKFFTRGNENVETDNQTIPTV